MRTIFFGGLFELNRDSVIWYSGNHLCFVNKTEPDYGKTSSFYNTITCYACLCEYSLLPLMDILVQQCYCCFAEKFVLLIAC